VRSVRSNTERILFLKRTCVFQRTGTLIWSTFRRRETYAVIFRSHFIATALSYYLCIERLCAISLLQALTINFITVYSIFDLFAT